MGRWNLPVSLHVNITRQGFEVWTCVHLQRGNTVVDVIFRCVHYCVRHHVSVYRALVQHVHDMLYVLAMFSCLFGSCLANLDGAR